MLEKSMLREFNVLIEKQNKEYKNAILWILSFIIILVIHLIVISVSSWYLQVWNSWGVLLFFIYFLYVVVVITTGLTSKLTLKEQSLKFIAISYINLQDYDKTQKIGYLKKTKRALKKGYIQFADKLEIQEGGYNFVKLFNQISKDLEIFYKNILIPQINELESHDETFSDLEKVYSLINSEKWEDLRNFLNFKIESKKSKNNNESFIFVQIKNFKGSKYAPNTIYYLKLATFICVAYFILKIITKKFGMDLGVLAMAITLGIGLILKNKTKNKL